MATANQATPQAAVTIKEQVREFVREHLAGVKGIKSFTDQESLLDSGVIDSLGIFRMVSFLEETFGIRVADEEITAENLQSIDVVEQLILAKRRK